MKCINRTKLTIQSLTSTDVLSVYSGRNGRCCCGCSGTHSYLAANRRAASKDRGYTVDDDEINDRQVVRVLNIIKRSLAVEDDGSCLSTVICDRLYVVYLKPAGRK